MVQADGVVKCAVEPVVRGRRFEVTEETVPVLGEESGQHTGLEEDPECGRFVPREVIRVLVAGFFRDEVWVLVVGIAVLHFVV